MGIHIGRLESVLEGSGANDGGAADRQGSRIGGAIGQRRHGAISGVNNRRIGGGRGDRETERSIIEAAIRAKPGIGDKGDEPAIIQGARRWGRKILVGQRRSLVFNQLRQDQEVEVSGALIESLDGQHVRARLE